MADQAQDGFFGWARHHPRLTDVLCLGLVLLVAVFFRAVYVAEYAMKPLGIVAIGPDVAEYDTWAKRLLVGAGTAPGVAFHAPLYPHFLAALYRHFGRVLPTIRNAQLFVDLLSLSLVWIAVRRLWRRRVACFAGLIWAGYLPLIYYSAELYAEVLVVFFLSAAFFLWSFLAGARRLRPPLFAAVGLCLGLAAISHPLSLLFGLAVVGLGPWLVLETPTRRQYLVASACLGFGLLVPIVPVSWNQSRQADAFVLVQDRSGFNLYLGNNPGADGTPYLPPGPEYQKLLAWPESEGVEGVGATQRFYRRQALRFAFSHPVQELSLLIQKFLWTWNAQEIPSGADLPELQLLTHFMRLPLPRFGWIAPLAILGFWLRRRDRRTWIWLLLPAAYTVALTIFVTSGRYRLPMVPALIVLAALALEELVQAWQTENTQTWRLATGIIVAAAVPICMIQPPAPKDSAARSWLLLAEAGWQVGDVSYAEKALEQADSLLPDMVAAHHLRALCLDARGDKKQALAEFATALRLNPRDSQILANYAATMAETGRAKEATKLLEDALPESRRKGLLWYELGVIAEDQGCQSEAVAAYRKALEAAPAYPSALLNLAILDHRAGRRAEAEALYRRCLRVAPRKARAHFGLAVLLAEEGHVQSAYRHFEPAVRYEPHNATFWQVYQQAARDAGDTDRATVLAKRAAEALAPPAPPPSAPPPQEQNP
jgi:Tfp pilus assembly protein PilF